MPTPQEFKKIVIAKSMPISLLLLYQEYFDRWKLFEILQELIDEY